MCERDLQGLVLLRQSEDTALGFQRAPVRDL
jgi:hypothetical protein